MPHLHLDELVQHYLDDFCICFGARIAVYDEAGSEMASGLGRRLCAYCTQRRIDSAFEARCHAADARARLAAQSAPGAISYRCHGGMTEAIRCLKIAGRTAGWVMIGQFRTMAAPLDLPLAYRQAFDAAPFHAPETVRSMLSIFDKLVDHLLVTHRVSLLDELLVERARRYIADNLVRPLQLAAAARVLGVSVSTLCHKFRAETGESFAAMHRRLRLERGIALLAAGTHRTVKEAAAAAGFADPLHFSRAVKRLSGRAPSLFVPSD
jgi:AraC-like DNA-binding protein